MGFLDDFLIRAIDNFEDSVNRAADALGSASEKIDKNTITMQKSLEKAGDVIDQKSAGASRAIRSVDGMMSRRASVAAQRPIANRASLPSRRLDVD
jgi:hypothetical protein